MAACYIFDVDGTLADLSHRLPHIKKEPKDWRAFFAACVDDKPINHMCELLYNLAASTAIVAVSGRSDEVRPQTEDWLRVATGIDFRGDKYLYMRKAGDHRPDYVVKGELLDALLRDGWEPIMVFEDRTQVVKLWRERGIPCAQVAEGDF